MWVSELFEIATEYLLFASCLVILFGSVFITVKMRFIQIRFLPTLIKIYKTSEGTKEGLYTILPHRALFTAMSTTLGIGTIVGPVIAMQWGGPGALLGFLLTAFFGSAATYTEVGLCIKFRKKLKSGELQGGPMQYLQSILSPAYAKWYAFWGSILMIAWSGAQANQLAAILDSPLLGAFRIPTFISGGIISLLLLFTLFGGIKRVSSLSAKLVPTMFILYLGSCSWILLYNIEQFWPICCLIIQSAFSPYAIASGTVVGGIVSALRWGVFKGTQATEAGVGTQTIPHSMAETEDPVSQGMLAMLSTYTAGIVSFLSGFVSLVTNTWQDPTLPMGISMVAASFQLYFSYFGIIIVTFSAILFAFGTILGNSYNGSQCFSYLAKGKKIYWYYVLTALTVYAGCILGVKAVWSLVDPCLACLVLPHMIALIKYSYQSSGEILVPVAHQTSSSKQGEMVRQAH